MSLRDLLFEKEQPPEDEKVRVPYLKGKTEEEAAKILTEGGLKVGKVTEELSEN